MKFKYQHLCIYASYFAIFCTRRKDLRLLLDEANTPECAQYVHVGMSSAEIAVSSL